MSEMKKKGRFQWKAMRNRTWKFRAWDNDEGRYSYFDFSTIYGYEGEGCGVFSDGVQINYNCGYGINGLNPDIEIEQFAFYQEIGTETAEIYEGDIVRAEVDQLVSTVGVIAEVYWDESMAAFWLDVPSEGVSFPACGGHVEITEVLGNIHETKR